MYDVGVGSADRLERMEARDAFRQIDDRTRPELIIRIAVGRIEVVVERPADDAVGRGTPKAIARERVVDGLTGHWIPHADVALPQPLERRGIGGVLHLALGEPRVADVDDQRQQSAEREHDQGDLHQHVRVSERRSAIASVP